VTIRASRLSERLPWREAGSRFGSALLSVLSVFIWLGGAALCSAQTPEAPPPALLSPQQLDDLVAPIALYPDPLLAQVLAASTYPTELAQAQQWVSDHPDWQASRLVQEAKNQNWDPSVQGLVAFPQVLSYLTQNMNWTAQLGDAFLAQQADVMQAVQRMRQEAMAKGALHSTPQEIVSTQMQNGQQVITIEPANPDVWYVPSYNPAYVWGPPAWGVYPALAYPAYGFGYGWYPGIDVGLAFGPWWGGLGWGGWGWYPSWYGGTIIVNNAFFYRHGFRGFEGREGRFAWAHNPMHRGGVPYPSPALANRFGGGHAFAGPANRVGPAPAVPGLGPTRNFGEPNRIAPAPNFRSPAMPGRNFGEANRMAPTPVIPGLGPTRNFGAAPQPRFAPQPQPRFAPQPQPRFAPQPQPRFANPGFGGMRGGGFGGMRGGGRR